MAYFRHGELDFYFEEYGSGTAFVFSHGLGGNVTRVREELGELPEVRLILYDNRGHGRTSTFGDMPGPNFSRMAADLAALLDKLGLTAAIIGGVSMGAGITLAFERQYRGRAKALILSRPAWLNDPNPPNLSAVAAIVDMIEKHGSHRAWQLLESSEVYTSLKNSFPETARSLKETFSVPGIEKSVLGFRSILASTPFDSLKDLEQIEIPTLVVGNHDDPIHPYEYAERLAASIPSAQLCEITSKSNSVTEHKHKFRSCVAEFLRTVI